MSGITKVPQRSISLLQFVLGGVCAALSLLLVLPVARISEQPVALRAEMHTCGEPMCAADSCSQTEWVGANTLRVTTIVSVPLTRQVDTDTATVAVKGTSLRITFITRGRSFSRGALVPACVMPVSLHFEVPGLVKQPYTVSTREVSSAVQYTILGLGAVFLLVPVLLFARAYTKARHLRVAA
jgi:hypothetical protein